MTLQKHYFAAVRCFPRPSAPQFAHKKFAAVATKRKREKQLQGQYTDFAGYKSQKHIAAVPFGYSCLTRNSVKLCGLVQLWESDL